MRSESKANGYLVKGCRVLLRRDVGNIHPIFTTFIQDVGGLGFYLSF